MQNLLTDPWLPFRLRDGSTQVLPVTAMVRDDIVDLALPREDFASAAYVLLIAILQTAMQPDDEEEWIDWFYDVPSEAALAQRLARIGHAFQISGSGPCFMQDFDLLEANKPVPVSGLLIDAPGENTIKKNTDHFIKRGVGAVMSPGMAALALWTLQVNAPAGGAGHRVGLRGGGPLTVLVLPEDPQASLWQKLWFNVIHKDLWPYDEPDLRSGMVFPWLAPTRQSEQPGTEVYAHDVHPLQMYWSMPRRIRLIVEDRAAVCAISGVDTDQSVRSYKTQNYGINYAGNWDHPLTPYRWDPKKPDSPELSLKGQPGGLNYKIWDVLTISSHQHGQRCPRNVVQYDSARRGLEQRGRIVPQLWVSGYDMDNMKARGWHAASMPVFAVSSEQQTSILIVIKELQELANLALWHCRSKIKAAWFESPGEAKGDMSFVDVSFWQSTESDFFDVVRSIVHSDGQVLNSAPAEQWLRILRETALRIFDQYAFTELGDVRSMSKRMQARRHLQGWLQVGKEVKAFKSAYQIQQTAQQESVAHE
ncbi:type I-E CRISPR-associated protein Cse1/CasA [Alcaligenes sp. SDU_A2]|uniref:type I-E CRISPR-associated protein Cse1/CasA n=1 Tax=Alcaligenes sp. SDU_A2 TaxID=3136634 RepID=UPI003120384D